MNTKHESVEAEATLNPLIEEWLACKQIHRQSKVLHLVEAKLKPGDADEQVVDVYAVGDIEVLERSEEVCVQLVADFQLLVDSGVEPESSLVVAVIQFHIARPFGFV